MDTTVTVDLGTDGFRAIALARGHALTMDEPGDLHGTDEGPTPIEAMLAALGACTAMTLRMYADRKGWDLRSVTVRLDHRQLTRADCLDCPPDADLPHVDRIGRAVVVEGDLTEEQVARMLDVANKCPVHRVLTRRPTVVTTLQVDARRTEAPSAGTTR
jgi:putative redox protein